MGQKNATAILNYLRVIHQWGLVLIHFFEDSLNLKTCLEVQSLLVIWLMILVLNTAIIINQYIGCSKTSKL